MSIGEIRKRNLAMLFSITLVLIATTLPATAYDANSPATYTIQYIIPSDTTFSVTLCGSETQMNFNPANGSSKSVEPACQEKAIDKPWANITNSGNLNLNFSTNLTTANPSWVSLAIASTSSMSDQIAVTVAATSPTGWLNVGPGNTVQLYGNADFTNAPQGTVSNTIKINSRG